MVDAAHYNVSPKFALQAGREAGVSMRATPFNFFNFFARLLLPSLGSFAQKAAYNQSSVNFVRVAIALEHYRLAHGEFPESLDALAPQFIAKLPHDIINGQPLHYRRTSDGQFVLYSVGWNETDDGGEIGPNKYGTADISKGDWVWRYPSK
jgi:type II secretory pathway pseudopilin PulG